MHSDPRPSGVPEPGFDWEAFDGLREGWRTPLPLFRVQSPRERLQRVIARSRRALELWDNPDA